jgi:hypothetical protein
LSLPKEKMKSIMPKLNLKLKRVIENLSVNIFSVSRCSTPLPFRGGVFGLF